MPRQYITKEIAIKKIQNHLNNSVTSVDVRLGICIGIARRASLSDLATKLDKIMAEVNKLSKELISEIIE